ncbi:MAG: SRPBCC domain-containing protein [Solirubrobacteraceae bacterium]
MTSHRVARRVLAPRKRVYQALIDPRQIAMWRAPAGMNCVVHEFDAREGGSFRVSLTYEDSGRSGKTHAHTDTYHGHFAKLVPDREVVEILEFETDDPTLAGEMTVSTRLADVPDGTEVTVEYEGLPAGVSVGDNETGTRMALDNLAALVEGQ